MTRQIDRSRKEPFGKKIFYFFFQIDILHRKTPVILLPPPPLMVEKLSLYFLFGKYRISSKGWLARVFV
ncbi:Uncharacterized protein APZ42_032804 [Daphnia magna]|uniref:Uncharacterized protein n=1 Tax=Daphnia magna TaxID=35525 RepID=A0A164LVN1_9CRUS|nr:Uncharacterized protein APZ42_032804 [Daphnia magna]